MVSTVHATVNVDRMDCIGHNLSPSGALWPFASRLKFGDASNALEELSRSGEPVWCPCTGGGLYRVSALSEGKNLIGGSELTRPRGFKSYNCDAIGYVVRAVGGKHGIALKAICDRDRSDSTSQTPTSCGLLMNQEINRVANMFEFWDGATLENGIKLYLEECRRSMRVGIDRVIARTLGEGLARRDAVKAVRDRVQDELAKHLALFDTVRKGRTCLLANC